MSFTPEIIINYDQLLEKETHIYASIYEKLDEDTLMAYGVLNESLIWAKEHGCIEFKNHNLRLVIVSPDLTSRNADVRELLDELGIEYQIDS